LPRASPALNAPRTAFDSGESSEGRLLELGSQTAHLE
jgi:hypothetical protein